MCSSPFNLCRSHSSALLSDLQPLFPFHPCDTPILSLTLPPSLSQHCGKTAIFGRDIVCLLPSSSHVCVSMESSVSPWSVFKSASQRCNEARLPSTACWDSTYFSPACPSAGQTEQHCHLLWLQIQFSSIFQLVAASFMCSFMN